MDQPLVVLSQYINNYLYELNKQCYTAYAARVKAEAEQAINALNAERAACQEENVDAGS